MTSVAKFIDQASQMLHSYTGIIEAATYLSEGMTDSATSLKVAHPQYITRGIIEVGDELMHVDTVSDAQVSLMPWGRGVQLSTPAPHGLNAKVINDPLTPRAAIFESLKRGIAQMDPDLYAVKTTTALFSPVVTTYEVPADVLRVLRVEYEVVGPSKEWLRLNNWTLDRNANTTTGKAIVIHDDVQPGRTMQITYAAPLPVPGDLNVDLEVSGIPISMHSVFLYWVAWETMQLIEPQRLQLRTVEQQVRQADVPAGAASNLAKQLYAMYQLRKSEERARLLTIYPTPKHFARY